MAKIYDDQKGARDEWAKLKNEPLKVKLQWLLEYYGLTALGVLVGIFIIVSITVTVILNKMPRIITGEFYTEVADTEYNEAMKEDLCRYLDYDAKKYQIDISSLSATLTTEDAALKIQRLVARVASQDIDFLVSSSKLFRDYTDPTDPSGSMFGNLKEILDEETLKQLEDAGRLLYIDTSDGLQPFAIDLKETRFYEVYKLQAPEEYIGFVYNAPHTDGITALVKLYILQ